LPPDLIPLLRKNKDMRVENIDPLGSIGIIRFNFLQPPFNNQKLRQALLHVVNQQDYVLGIAATRRTVTLAIRSSPAERRCLPRSAPSR